MRSVRRKEMISYIFKMITRGGQLSMLSRKNWHKPVIKEHLRKMPTIRDTSISRSTRTVIKREMGISLLIMKTSGRESTTMNLLVLRHSEPTSMTMKPVAERLLKKRWPRKKINCKNSSN